MHIYFHEKAQPWPDEPGAVVLERTEWNDWWRWRTLFYAYLNNDGGRTPLGAVKIADLDLEYEETTSGGTITELPVFFDGRPGKLISVGQDESYYSSLRKLLGVTRMRQVLSALGDLAQNQKRFRRHRRLPVVTNSLLRSVPAASVSGVFARIVTIGHSRVEFDFTYVKPSLNPLVTEPMRLDFAVVPESSPPTNVHVLIGRNGAGKTTVMRSMAKALVDPATTREQDGWFEADAPDGTGIANVVYIAFSAFDEAVVPVVDLQTEGRSYSYVGLQYTGSKESDSNVPIPLGAIGKGRVGTRSVAELERAFASSAWAVSRMKSLDLWLGALKTLESDRNFKQARVSALARLLDEGTSQADFKREARRKYGLLSSGHKIVLLTVTRLVETVTEKTLVLLDEPEGHLHPPLLAAFVRALSDLLRERNGIAIVSTHSPVIVQEVPRSCVWKLNRDRRVQTAERLNTETFGENAGTLTSTVFGLEVEESGFHRMVSEAAGRLGTYEAVVEEFNQELGFEARAALKALIANRDS